MRRNLRQQDLVCLRNDVYEFALYFSVIRSKDNTAGARIYLCIYTLNAKQQRLWLKDESISIFTHAPNKVIILFHRVFIKTPPVSRCPRKIILSFINLSVNRAEVIKYRCPAFHIAGGKQPFRYPPRSTEQYDPIYRRMRRASRKILFISVELRTENFLRPWSASHKILGRDKDSVVGKLGKEGWNGRGQVYFN